MHCDLWRLGEFNDFTMNFNNWLVSWRSVVCNCVYLVFRVTCGAFLLASYTHPSARMAPCDTYYVNGVSERDTTTMTTTYDRMVFVGPYECVRARSLAWESVCVFFLDEWVTERARIRYSHIPHVIQYTLAHSLEIHQVNMNDSKWI